VQGLIGADFFRVPEQGTPVVSDLDLIGALFGATAIGLQLPTQAGLFFAVV